MPYFLLIVLVLNIRGRNSFVIQMEGVSEVRPNTDTDPAFASALENAVRAGVKPVFITCRVAPDSLEADGKAGGL